MLLQHLYPGRTNASISSVCTSIYNNYRYIVYATGGNLILYTTSFSLIQSVCLDSYTDGGDITAVAMNSNGVIAASCSKCVVLLRPRSENDNCGRKKWEYMGKLEHPSRVTCMDMSDTDLLVAGEDILMYHFQKSEDTLSWSSVWEQRLPSPTKLVKLSPQGIMCATVGFYDKLVKVWWKDGEESDRHSFLYLPHPKPVMNFEWRKSEKDSDPILFTMSTDGICRIWSPTNPTTPHAFQLSAIIDPNQFLVTSQSHSTSSSNSPTPATFPENPILSSHYLPIHWIPASELLDAISYASVGKDPDLVANNPQLKRLKDLSSETPDLFFQIQTDGSLAIWGIQNLGCHPLRIPKVLAVMRISQVISQTDAKFFAGRVLCFHDPLEVLSRDKVITVRLAMLVTHPDGRLNYYHMDMVDLLASNCPSYRLFLKYEWAGHCWPIGRRLLVRQRNGSTVLSASVRGWLEWWQCESPQFGFEVQSWLRERAILLSPKGVRLITILSDNCIAVYDGDVINLYVCSDLDGIALETTLNECKSNEEIVFLHCFEVDNQPANSVYLLAVSEKGESHLWRISLTPSHYVSSITFIASQDLLVTPSLVIAFDDWDGVFPLTPAMRNNSPVFATYEGGLLHFWAKDKAVGDGWKWSKLLAYPFEKDARQILLAPAGYIVTVHRRDNNQGDVLSIWSLLEHNTPPSLEHTRQFDEEIVQMALRFGTDAQYYLAIGVHECVYIFGRHRNETGALDSPWVILDKLEIDSEGSISGIIWSTDGTLVVAKGCKLFVYSKWMEQYNLEKLELWQAGERISNCSTLFAVGSVMNRTLPYYHPDLLIQLLMWGNFDLVDYILARVCSFLQLMNDANKNVVDIPAVPFEKFIMEDQSEEMKSEEYTGLFDRIGHSEGSSNKLTSESIGFFVEHLSRISLPSINHLEQLYLMAIIDNISQITRHRGYLDDNGVRYFVFLRRHYYLNRLLPPTLRKPNLEYRDIVWALHSGSQDLLLEYSRTCCSGKLLWQDARTIGLFLWYKKGESLRDLMEEIARNEYMNKDERDPVKCSLFYFALKKKRLLLGLWKVAHSHKEQQPTMKFLSNDFDEPRWQKAALKNAYALLGKQRYAYAAAFFLLGNRLRDAVNVCLQHLNDFQLAIAICRVYEGDDSPIFKDIMRSHILPQAIEKNDRWLANLALWWLNERDQALRATMVPLESLLSKTEAPAHSLKSACFLDPTLLILYKYLKEKTNQTRRLSLNISFAMERQFVLDASVAYERMGCPALALFLLQTWIVDPPATPQRQSTKLFTEKKVNPPPTSTVTSAAAMIDSGIVDFDSWGWNDAPKPKQSTSKSTVESSIMNDTTIMEEPQSMDTDVPEASLTNGKADAFNNPELDGYKVLLVMEWIHQAMHGVSAICELPSRMLNSTLFQDHLSHLNRSLDTLCGTLQFLPEDVDRILVAKCTEEDDYGLLARMFSHGIIESVDATKFAAMLLKGCYRLIYLAVRLRIDDHWDRGLTIHLKSWARNVLSTLPLWEPVVRQVYRDRSLAHVGLSSFFTLCLTSIHLNEYQDTWACMKRFHLLWTQFSENGTNARSLVQEILESSTELVDLQAIEDPFSDFEFDDKMVSLEEATLADVVLELATVNYMILTIESLFYGEACAHSDELKGFILTGFLEPLIFTSKVLMQKIGNTRAYEVMSEGTVKDVMRYFSRQEQARYLQSLCTLTDVEKLLPFLSAPESSISAPEIVVSNAEEQLEVIFKPANVLHSFCFSQTDATMVVATRSHVIELDLNQELARVPDKSKLTVERESELLSEFDSDTGESEGISPGASDTEETRRLGEKAPDLRVQALTRQENHQQGQHLERPYSGNIGRNLSFENLQQAVKRSYNSLFSKGHHRSASPAEALDSQNELLRRKISVTCVESHPTFPFYITGFDAAVNQPCAKLWQFQQSRELMSYYGSEGRITRVQFDSFGQKLGATSKKGILNLWRVESGQNHNRPFLSIQCHSRSAYDFAFLDSNSLIATVGQSVNENNICIWDTLLPTHRAMIAGITALDHGAQSVAFSSRRQALFSGGKNGELCVVDVRQRKLINTFPAHAARIRSLVVDDSRDLVITSSSEGDIKFWNSGTLEEFVVWPEVQARNRFLTHGFENMPGKWYGVMQLRKFNECIYACGPKGLVRRHIPEETLS
ncbi:uncharacterized protein VTP21DRAFT_7223 [Calcarisporiella thermophila]|uniref:uncharacterized protein n=1 Tax=Calcarisporiella thermophila TaxID=911321 RepID=UPI003742D8DC